MRIMFLIFIGIISFISCSINEDENEVFDLLSLLQEKDLVTQKDTNYLFHLPFDLHSLDCGASDCYITNIDFEIPFTTSLSFPEEIFFKLQEEGCVAEEKLVFGKFQLMEDANNCVSYYCKALGSSLIIFKEESCHALVYYFPLKLVKSKEVCRLLDNSGELNEVLIPYRISILVTRE